ncbi:STAS/SEC14 domain-containing protein [Methyloligella sp. 2.7D]|uniref:STAS/SEC14 domain-containing protein n=1 Tax=unclassified Methyloligella TaxID=2625955 RepID=UPI00157D907A|nr:STAS/SEC14 domain-containing protein [Methyloligella sp. GL2]QKP76804.1 STAS/SEC14 domain-containing protein [Methyloligella sp. GL2]
MLSYKESDNAKTAEITVSGRVSTEEFDAVAAKLEAFIARHGDIRVLEIVESFEGMDATAFWHDIRFSLRHLKDLTRCAVVCEAKIVDLWSELVAPFSRCEVRYFKPGEEEEARDWLRASEDAEF